MDEMKPSAEERTNYIRARFLQIGMEPAIDEGVEKAYRDGAAAERARILAIMRAKPLLASIHAIADEIEKESEE